MSDYKDSEKGVLKSSKDERELYELSDKIISVTEYMKEFIIKYYNIPEEKIGVIHNGIDNTNFHILVKGEKDALKHSLGFRKDDKIVLFSGRLDSSKGIYYLLNAFAEVIKKFDNIQLVLIGEDSGPDKICQYLNHCENIWSKITFTGFLEYENVLKFYQIADIGIIPSIYDHCPFVALEMIGQNVPLIISNTEGLNEILTDDQSVYLTPLFDNEGYISFDKREIAQSILSLLYDDKKAKRITREYSELIRSQFSAQRMAGEMYSIFKSLSLTTVET